MIDFITYLVSSMTRGQWLVAIFTMLALACIAQLWRKMNDYRDRWLDERQLLWRAQEDAIAWKAQAQAWMRVGGVEPKREDYTRN